MKYTKEQQLVINYCLYGTRVIKENREQYRFILRNDNKGIDQGKMARYMVDIISIMEADSHE